jgi:hypothetical protein
VGFLLEGEVHALDRIATDVTTITDDFDSGRAPGAAA